MGSSKGASGGGLTATTDPCLGPPKPMPLTIEASDVIRLIEQFLSENGLISSLRALQEETGVCQRSVDDIDRLLADICAGRWEAVFRVLTEVQLEARKLINLYELVFWELAESGDIDGARMVLRESEPMALLRSQDETRYMGLENGLSTAVLSRTAGAKIDLVDKKEAKRARIAQELAPHLVSVPKSRLVTLLGQALRFEEQQLQLSPNQLADLRYDVFRGIVPVTETESVEHDAIANVCYRTVTLPTGQHVEAAAFSPDGSFFAVGLADGFIEIWNPALGQPRKDLPYQGHKSTFMIMETAVLAMAFAPDNQTLAVGTLNGDVALWKVSTGSCIRRIPKAHSGAVASLQFAPDGHSLLTAGYDGGLRLYNLRTGALLRQFPGQGETPVYAAVFAAEGQRVISAGSDGVLRIWETRTGDCIHCVTPSGNNQLAQRQIRAVVPIPRHPDMFLVCAQDSPLQVFGAIGAQGKTLALPKSCASFIGACCSHSGKYIYGLGADRKAYCYDYATAGLLRTLELATSPEHETIGAVHHPHANLMATFDTGNSIKFWRAK